MLKDEKLRSLIYLDCGLDVLTQMRNCGKDSRGDLKALMDKAEINGCKIVENIAEETCRPGMLVGKIKDRFSHIWELSSSAASKRAPRKFTKKLSNTACSVVDSGDHVGR
ncbi:unnamed protein product [Prunus brigantina]